MPIKFLVGGSANFIFMDVGIVLIIVTILAAMVALRPLMFLILLQDPDSTPTPNICRFPSDSGWEK